VTPANVASTVKGYNAIIILLDISEGTTIIFEHKFLKFMRALSDLLFLLLDFLCFLLRGGGGLHWFILPISHRLSARFEELHRIH
jgi:hypothetical protein